MGGARGVGWKVTRYLLAGAVVFLLVQSRWSTPRGVLMVLLKLDLLSSHGMYQEEAKAAKTPSDAGMFALSRRLYLWAVSYFRISSRDTAACRSL